MSALVELHKQFELQLRQMPAGFAEQCKAEWHSAIFSLRCDLAKALKLDEDAKLPDPLEQAVTDLDYEVHLAKHIQNAFWPSPYSH